MSARFYGTIGFAVVVLVVLTVSSCQTPKKEGDSSGKVPAARIVFRPYVQQVAVQAGEGAYPALFTGASHAIWGDIVMKPVAMTMEGTPTKEAESVGASEGSKSKNDGGSGAAEGSSSKAEGGASKPDESMMQETSRKSAQGQPLRIACFLESQFSDMSIAYDAVGLRGMSIYLELPDGTQLLPVQKVLDTELKEVSVGALRRYGRKITLYFSSRPIIVDNPAVTPNSRGVRLVLEGHKTKFYFEWPPMPDSTLTARKTRWDEHALKATKTTYRDVAIRAKRLSHELD